MTSTDERERNDARRHLAQRTGRDLDQIGPAEIDAEVRSTREYAELMKEPLTHDEAARLAWPAA